MPRQIQADHVRQLVQPIAPIGQDAQHEQAQVLRQVGGFGGQNEEQRHPVIDGEPPSNDPGDQGEPQHEGRQGEMVQRSEGADRPARPTAEPSPPCVSQGVQQQVAEEPEVEVDEEPAALEQGADEVPESRPDSSR